MRIDLSPWQSEVWDDNHRYKVINAGRRAGKTMLVTMKMVDFASKNDEVKVWYIAPTYKQAKQIVWEMLHTYIPKPLIARKNETELVVVLKNGSKIELKGADNPDSLRGVGLDLIMFDEVAFFNRWDECWKILRPTLADSGADCYFISTPNGMNHFKELADNYVPKEDRKIFKDEDVVYFHFTTYDNPYIELDEIELMKAEMDDDSFSQEILGEFRKMTGLIYKTFNRETHMVKIPFEKFNSNWTYTRSLDFGFAHKSALIYVAISPTGDEMYVYDGVYQDGLTETDIANICIVKDAGKVITNPVADSAQPMSIEQLSQLGVHFNPVEKGADSVKNGITKVSELLKIRADTGKPTLMFNQSLPWIADEMEKYRWMERKTDGVVKEVPYKKQDDFCFTAGTPIITKRGNIPIEKVTTKDLVYTPYGWSRVISCSSTGIKPVKDYGVFTATPNHKIITNRGVVELDAISNSDTIMVCKTKQSAGTVSIIEDIPTQKTELIDFILKGLLTRDLGAKLAFYTEKYGSRYTEKYPKAIISIIKMVTHLITTLTTLCYLLPKSIIILIQLILNGIIKSTLTKLDHLLKSGIDQQRGVLYTRLLEKWLGLIRSGLQRIVQSVVKSTKPLSLQEANTVIKTAKQQPLGDAEVFNLATSRGMYFANNVLVSNCDSLRYYAMSYKKPHQRLRKSRRSQLVYSTMGKNLY